MNTTIRMMANIAAVERETGLGKDTLRVWERRYGFPVPERDGNGDRLYPGEQIERLRVIKRLMDRGHRPGKLLAAGEDELRELAALPAGNRDAADRSDAPERSQMAGDIQGLESLIDTLRRHDVTGLRQALSQQIGRVGLQGFVMDNLPALNALIGEGWESGAIEVFEEHLYTEQVQIVLRQAIAGLPAGTRSPAVLLTTVPEEQHVLGILMLEALLTLQGNRCISLGTQTPLSDIVSAVAAHRTDVVALSFSGAFPARQVQPLVEQLRAALPPGVGLWIGGSGVDRGFEKRIGKRNAHLQDGERSGEITVCRSLVEVIELAGGA